MPSRLLCVFDVFGCAKRSARTLSVLKRTGKTHTAVQSVADLAGFQFGMRLAVLFRQLEKQMKILMASDGSANALAAADFIVGLAKSNEIEVHLIQVLGEKELSQAGAVSPWMPVWSKRVSPEHMQQLAQVNVDALAMLSCHCRSVSMSYPCGEPRGCILAEAESRAVDLIVMGAHGHSVLDRVVLGSVSEHVATHADCSVAVVRPNEQGVLRQTPKKITIGYDCSQGAYRGVQEMLKFNWTNDAQINVVSVTPIDLSFRRDRNLGVESEKTSQIRNAGENLCNKINARGHNAQHHLVQAGHPGEAVVRSAEETNSDFILVGETGHKSIARWILGSTTSFVLRHAPCTVWVSKHHRKTNTKLSPAIPRLLPAARGF